RFAKLSQYPDASYKIAFVYTRDEYRGKGYARKVVNSVKNEILDKGFVATLNVDQKNPISNHLYESLGFKKVFSQGVYVPKNKEV
ncbi:MAG: GNAT family N-acetyltransferase, partial [Gammaproteobacteria bacterium]|nr:GNAT family N-acetyltransferase [Gammaproteobacteria bacterium]